MLDRSSRDIEEIQIMRVEPVDNKSQFLKIVVGALGLLFIGFLFYFAWKGITMGSQSTDVAPVETAKAPIQPPKVATPVVTTPVQEQKRSEPVVVHTQPITPKQVEVQKVETSLPVQEHVVNQEKVTVATPQAQPVVVPSITEKPQMKVEQAVVEAPIKPQKPSTQVYEKRQAAPIETLQPVEPVMTQQEKAAVTIPTTGNGQNIDLQQLIQVVRVVVEEMNNEKNTPANSAKSAETLQPEAIAQAMIQASNKPATADPTKVEVAPTQSTVRGTTTQKQEVTSVEETTPLIPEVTQKPFPVVAATKPEVAPSDMSDKKRELEALLNIEIDDLSESEVESLTAILSKKKTKKKDIAKEVDSYNKVVRKKSDRLQATDLLSQIANDIAAVVESPEAVGETDNYTTSIKKEVKTRTNEMRYIVVKNGDTLSKIAQKVYGDASKYPKIFKANPDILRRADRIFIGQRLRVPL